MMYFTGQDVSKDYKTAVKWFRLAAEQGHLLAQANLGWIHYKGIGVSQDHEIALKYHRLVLKSDAANFLSGGLTGAAGKIGGKLLSFIRGDTKSVDARDSVAETISQPVPTGGESSDTDGGGGAGAAGAVINSGAPGAVASANPMSRDRTKPSNLALALIAVDTRNIHILQSKSVFNIVDAI